jgi:hypothetical protein
MRKLIIAGLLLLLCLSLPARPNSTTPDMDLFAELRSTVSRIPGWAEQKERYRSFTATELYEIIDGGATEYQKQGLIKGIVAAWTSEGKSLEIYFDKFGSSSRAKDMVKIKKKSSNEPHDMPKGHAVSAVYDPVIGGCVVFWSKDCFYMEMTLTGYDSPRSEIQDAQTIIDSLSPVIGK